MNKNKQISNIQKDKQLLNKFANYYYLLNDIIDNLNGYVGDTKYINKYQSVEMLKNTFDTISVRELEIAINQIQDLMELQEEKKEMVLQDKENNKNI